MMQSTVVVVAQVAADVPPWPRTIVRLSVYLAMTLTISRDRPAPFSTQ